MFSAHDVTWDRELKKHSCCGSKHSYHMSSCSIRNSTIPGRASDPDFVMVQRLKEQNPGITSKEVAREMNLPLAQINDLWIQ